MPLDEEGITVYRPVLALRINDHIYKILEDTLNNQNDEVWAFKPGEVVEVVEKEFENKKSLVAVNLYKE